MVHFTALLKGAWSAGFVLHCPSRSEEEICSLACRGLARLLSTLVSIIKIAEEMSLLLPLLLPHPPHLCVQLCWGQPGRQATEMSRAAKLPGKKEGSFNLDAASAVVCSAACKCIYCSIRMRWLNCVSSCGQEWMQWEHAIPASVLECSWSILFSWWL